MGEGTRCHLKAKIGGACPRWRSARTFLIALRRLNPHTARLPPGVLGFSPPVGAELRRSRGRSWARPGSWGCGRGAARGAAWAPGRVLPSAALADGAPGIEVRGLTLGPLITGDRRGTWHLAVGVPERREMLLHALLDWGLLTEIPRPGAMGRGR
ncbi:hypothetical protein NDU88_006209 [Pleurodeles waltl]|uniref:Uncharacterized protein n=1 Tax=Pleurodeles waltl TaxID=8319 RepID=A0AAV7RN67_PLEWA|nr:hypothetical protein NDU88_006209 [Pleurodeles waltl]